MGFIKTIVLIVSLSCLIHTIAAVQAPSSTPVIGSAWRRRVNSPHMMVMNLCKNITNTPLCLKTLLAEKTVPSTPIKALETEVLLTKSHVTATKAKIGTLLSEPKISKDMNESLSICRDQYDNMLDSIKETLKATSDDNPTEAKYKMSSIISYQQTCEENFMKSVNPTPISRENKYVYDMTANCLDIIKKLEDKQMNRILRRFKGNLPPPPPEISSNKNDPCFGVVGICGSY